MKNLLLVFFAILLSSCTVTSINKSAETIPIENKEFIIMGNLRVVIFDNESKYDKIMSNAITTYGPGVDIINIKEDKQQLTGQKIINCLVIKYQ